MRSSAFAAGLSIVSVASAAHAASFNVVTPPDGGGTYAQGISGDGQVVVGQLSDGAKVALAALTAARRRRRI